MPKFSIFHTIAVATLLSACSHSGSSNVGIIMKKTPVADAANRSGLNWLVGQWAPKVDGCQSDNGIEFASDGTFKTADSSGRWVLAGNRLTFLTTEEFEVGPDRPSIKIADPDPHSHIIRLMSNTEYESRPAGGKPFRLIRC